MVRSTDDRVLRVAVLMGGPSREHEISLASGRAVAGALRRTGFDVDEILLATPELPDLDQGIDVVFPALHGEFGEDGTVQRLLEGRGVPFVGSDSVASNTIIDKQQAKSILKANNLPVAGGELVTSPGAPVPDGLEFPAILKPNREGSTIGLKFVQRPDDWDNALREAFAYGDEVLAERFIKGTEITVGLVAGIALPVIEIVPPGNVFDYDAKYLYSHGETQYLCPCKDLSSQSQRQVQMIAEDVYRVLGARDMLRVDMIVESESRDPLVLEANSIPGFTEQSLLPKAAAAAGIEFNELCERLVIAAYQREQ